MPTFDKILDYGIVSCDNCGNKFSFYKLSIPTTMTCTSCGAKYLRKLVDGEWKVEQMKEGE